MKAVHHFHRPIEHPFTSAERGKVTIILGGLTWKHERLIQAVLQRNGQRCETLPQPDRDAHEIGKEYCDNGLCNPAYFTVGNLIKHLRELERNGLSRSEIVKNYVFFTAGSCGPCRFGMYEAQFRSALGAAGYGGFRVVLFLQDHGIKASSGQSGLEFSVDFGMLAFHAFVLGDLLNDLHHKLRAYESVQGEADRVISALVNEIAESFGTLTYFDLAEAGPKPLRPFLQRHRSTKLFRVCNTLSKLYVHLYGSTLTSELERCSQLIGGMEMDRLQVKPLVKIIGEFWAQLTEGDGNFRMFEFLESEGAEVAVEPVSTWILYLMHQAKRKLVLRRRVVLRENGWRHPLATLSSCLRLAGKYALYSVGEHIYRNHYQRLAKALGGFTEPLLSQQKLAKLADPHYCSMLEGGEGHLEVAKNLHYTASNKSHMVLALKPFGCLPSMQSDAVQASLVEKNPEMLFLSVETAGEGEIHAHSRVQMALADAKTRARREYESVLASLQHSPEQIRDFVRRHKELRSPFFKVSRHPGVVATGANFMLDVNAMMNGSSGTLSPSGVSHERSSARVSIDTTPSHQETNNV